MEELMKILVIPIVVIVVILIDLWCEYQSDKTLGNCDDLKSFISWKKIDKKVK